MENQFLIPANTKKGQLIFSMFRPLDLAILVTGGVVTFVLLLLLNDAGTFVRIISIFPLVVCALLVFPIPNYHNSLVAIQEIINFYCLQTINCL